MRKKLFFAALGLTSVVSTAALLAESSQVKNVFHSIFLLDTAGTKYAELTASDSMSSSLVFTLPDSAGTNGQVLATDGSGNLDWTSSQPVDPTALSNTNATKLGLKTYYHGTTYNGGIAPTTSGSSWTTYRAWFQPYQDQAGNWFMRFNVSGLRTGTVSGFVVSINGITSETTTNNNQNISYGTCVGVNATTGNIGPNDNALVVNFGASQNVGACTSNFGGTIELDSKPTWAY